MRKRVFLALLLIASLLSLVWLVSSRSTASRSLTRAEPSTTPSMPSKEAVSAKLATLERGWVKNEGQWDERALFSAPGYFGNTWITKDGELLHAAVKKEECKDKTEKAKACPSKSWVISERWVGGKVQTIKGEEELQTKVSYFIGNDPSKHRSGLSTYRYVSLGEVWSGVEVRLKATQKTVEKLFYVQPGADPSKIVVQVDGAKGLKLSKDGEIIIKTGLGELKLSKPVAWQEKDGKKLPVEVSYKLIGKNRYSFEVAKADPSLPIVIDPILQSAYLGGSRGDFAYALAISGSDVYVVGYTLSNDFPGTSGRASNRPDSDAFVAKLNSSLNLLQSTYLGGSRDDFASALAISGSDVYVLGYTLSNDFPGATGRDSSRFDQDAFVAKLNSSFTSLQSTYLGGRGWDYPIALAISGSDVYVVGYTNSNDFPGTSGRASSRSDQDAFVAKLNSSFTSLQSAYLGGRRFDSPIALAISGSDVYVVGYTNSNDFPGTSGRASSRLDQDAFVTKLNSSFTSLQSTYLGGSNYDSASALAISSTGDVYVAGDTLSNDFPGATGRDPSRRDQDAFVAKLNSSLTSLQSTYLGGSRDDFAKALAISGSNVYVLGYTFSSDFPGATPRDPSRSDNDAFVAKLNSSFTSLQSTYVGGSGGDFANALAISGSDVYVLGYTYSNDFPGTSGRASSRSDPDAFVAKLNSSLNLLQSTYLGGRDEDYARALAISGSNVYVVGDTKSNDFPGATGRDSSRSDWDAFVAKLSTDGGGSGSGGGGGGGGGSGGGSGSGGGGSGGGGGCNSASPDLYTALLALVLTAVLRKRIRKVL